MSELPETQEIPLNQLEHVGDVVLFPVLKKKRQLTAFATRHADGIAVYLNSCPHFSSPLAEKTVLDDAGMVRCEVHGATFDPTTGACKTGPCQGQFLRALTFESTNTHIRVPTQIVRRRSAETAHP